MGRRKSDALELGVLSYRIFCQNLNYNEKTSQKLLNWEWISPTNIIGFENPILLLGVVWYTQLMIIA